MILMNRTEFTDLEAFHKEIKRVQTEAHGKHYCDNHDALIRYGKACKVVKELGVAQGGTLAALMLTGPARLVGIDIKSNRFNPYQKLFTDYANKHGIQFEFIKRSSLDRTLSIPCDLLHIDSCHTAVHLWQELHIHAPTVRKYIVFHDTHAIPALLTIIKLYIWETGQEWQLIENHKRNVGYSVINRIV